MRGREHSSALVFSLAALAFALLAGIAIPLGGGGSRMSHLDWTPPPAARARTTAVPATPTQAPRATVAAKPAATSPPAATLTAVPSPSLAPPTTVPTTTPIIPSRARVSQGPLNLRAGPGTTYAVLATAKSGDEFAVTGRSEDGRWVQLCCVAQARVWAAAEFAELPATLETYSIVR